MIRSFSTSTIRNSIAHLTIQNRAKDIAQQLKIDVYNLRETLRSKSLNMVDNERKFLQQLDQSTTTSLLKLCRSVGIGVGSRAKQDMLRKLYGRASLANQIFYAQTTASPTLVFIDVGVKNMAWSRVDISRMKIIDCGVEDITYNYYFNLDSNMPSDFAAATTRFVAELKSKLMDKPTIFVIEQQMQRHNPRCLMLEAQLHALLFPKSISISPASVSKCLGLTNRSTSDSKKRLGILLVEYLSDENGIISLDKSVRETLQNKNKKTDDICDCILNSLTFYIWSQRLLLVLAERNF